MPGSFPTPAEVRASNNAAGHHWFDRKTTRAFDSRNETALIRGPYFISSELGFFGDDRALSVREVSDDAGLARVREFRRHVILAEARVGSSDLRETRKSAAPRGSVCASRLPAYEPTNTARSVRECIRTRGDAAYT